MGFTLLLSVLVISMILAVSLGISSIIRGEIILSSTGRQSQLAFYAADAGLECGIYWDTLHSGMPQSAFATSTPDQNDLRCAGATIPVGGPTSCVNSLDGSGSSAPCAPGDKKAGVSTFTLNLANDSCAKVTVTKREFYIYEPPDPTPNEAGIETFIHSDGFSEGDSACESNSPRVYQRSIETTTFE